MIDVNISTPLCLEMTQKTVSAWQAKAAQKRATVYAKIPQEWTLDESTLQSALKATDASVLHVPRECGILTDREVTITESVDATGLLEKIRSGAFSTTEVTIAFCKRAAIAHQLVNCLTEIFFDQAIQRAQELDDFFQKYGKVKGPLHGLPVSLKDSFQIRGIYSTLGYISFLKNGPAETDSSMTSILLQAGAVLFVKTNVPQTLMAADTVNNVFGRTLNPHNVSLGPGGSSGGEGALVALRGSLLGIGTDIGGSCRVPALCCGVYGFRPTANRLPFGKQVLPSRSGWPGIEPCAGPLATTVRDVRLFMQTVIDHEPWNIDWSTYAIPWHTEPQQMSKRLSIGVILEDVAYPVSPSVAKAVRTATAELQIRGHQVSYLSDFPSIKEGYDVALEIFGLDDGRSLRHVHEGEEPFVKVVQDVLELFSDKTAPTKISELGPIAVRRDEQAEAWHKVFVDGGFDVLITPGAAHTALPHDQFCITPYTALWNLVDFPACVVPLLQADMDADIADKNFSSNESSGVDRAPKAVQVIGLRMMDEKLISAVEIIAGDLSLQNSIL